MGLDKKWFQIRYDLYLSLKEQVRARIGGDPADLRRYRKPFREEARKPWRLSNQKALLEAISKTDVVLCGDFHPLEQSQKAFVRILRTSQNSKKKKVIALECYFIEHQKIWEQYLSGHISETQFLKQIDWGKIWPFPWANYKPIIKWAQKNNVNIYPCNTLQTQNLKQRDELAAHLLQKLYETHKDKNVILFVLYGDLHLAQPHLPKALKNSALKKIKICRVFQNIDEIYFEIIKRDESHGVEVVQKDPLTFCLLGVPPWVKWQSYLMFLEEYADKNLYEAEIEFTDHVVRYVQFLSEEFGTQVSLHQCAIYSAQDDHFLDRIKGHLPNQQIKIIERMVEEGYSFFIPEVFWGYLGRVTVNHASSLAMQYFFYEFTQTRRLPWNMPKDFCKMIWLEAVSYFGSKLVNPKRKTESLKDLKMSLISREKEGFGQEALKLALAQRVREMMGASGRQLNFKPKNKWSYFLAAHMLGALLGERLYTAYVQNKKNKKIILQLISKSMDSVEFIKFYYKTIQWLEDYPVGFESKLERF